MRGFMPPTAGSHGMNLSAGRTAPRSTAIEGWTSTRNDLRAMRELQAVGVPACAALAVADLFEDPHLKERGAFVDFDDGRTPRLPGMPWRWEGVKFRIFRAPGTGEHNLLLAGTDEGRSHAPESARQP